MKIERRRWLFRGRVQGVGFRALCYDRALAHGVQGHVRNLPDGSVEAETEASPAVLFAWREDVCRQACGVRVDSWEDFLLTPKGDPHEGFNIRY